MAHVEGFEASHSKQFTLVYDSCAVNSEAVFLAIVIESHGSCNMMLMMVSWLQLNF